MRGSTVIVLAHMISSNPIINNLCYICKGVLLWILGMVVKETVLLLNYLINEEQYFSLNELNQCLKEFELGYMEAADRCAEIANKNIHSGTRPYILSQSGK